MLFSFSFVATELNTLGIIIAGFRLNTKLPVVGDLAAYFYGLPLIYLYR